MKCYFCGDRTNGKQFYANNLDTDEKEIYDVCNDCYGDDLELVTS